MTKTNQWGALAAAAGTLVAVGLILLIMLVVVEAGPAEATFPGKPGKIAYSGEDGPNGDYELYTINPGGGGKFNVTDNSTDDYYPSYSPSGKKIAYVNVTGTEGEIWTIQPNGAGKHRVTNNASNDRSPYWGSQ